MTIARLAHRPLDSRCYRPARGSAQSIHLRRDRPSSAQEHVPRACRGRPPAAGAAQQRLFAVVPLPGDEGAVAHRLQLARQRRDTPHVIGRAHPAPAGHDHRPARHAHRAAVRAERVVALEAEALGGQLVEVRGVDPLVAPGTDRVGALIVREQEKDVRLVGRCRCGLAHRLGGQGKGAEREDQYQDYGRDHPLSARVAERFGSERHLLDLRRAHPTGGPGFSSETGG